MRSPDPVRETAFAVASYLHALDPGPLANVRRMTPDLGAPAFWRLCARHDPIAQRTDDWLQITRILAILTAKGAPGNRPLLHNAKRPFGAVLCDGGDPNWRGDRPAVKEARLGRLLAARGQQRAEQLERLARMLAGQLVPGSGVDTGDIAWAILNPAGSRGIAETYYDRFDRATATSTEGKET